MQKIIIISVLIVSVFSFSFFMPQEEGVKWISVNEVDALYAKEPRPILIDVYTSWCGWCKVMDKKTYTNEKLATYINTHFYAVKLDAETNEKLIFNNKTYSFDAAARSNSFAVYLLGGQMSFPTTVLLASPDSGPAPMAGYLKPEEMEAPLKYFGEKAYAAKSYNDFSKELKKEW